MLVSQFSVVRVAIVTKDVPDYSKWDQVQVYYRHTVISNCRTQYRNDYGDTMQRHESRLE